MWDALYEKDLILIFPERTTHNLLQMRPLKVGVSIMALGAAEKFNTKVMLVPCVLHFYHQHEFRSNVFVEYGNPLEVPS